MNTPYNDMLTRQTEVYDFPFYTFRTFFVFELWNMYWLDPWYRVHGFTKSGQCYQLPMSHDGYVTLELKEGTRRGCEHITYPGTRFHRENPNLMDVNVRTLMNWAKELKRNGGRNPYIIT